MNVLFICSKNKLRSPTGEFVAREMGFNSDSAGLLNDAVNVLSREQIVNSDIIFVMENKHKEKLKSKFRDYLNNKKIITLGIPDNYDYMQPELIEIFKQRLPQFLKQKKLKF